RETPEPSATCFRREPVRDVGPGTLRATRGWRTTGIPGPGGGVEMWGPRVPSPGKPTGPPDPLDSPCHRRLTAASFLHPRAANARLTAGVDHHENRPRLLDRPPRRRRARAGARRHADGPDLRRILDPVAAHDREEAQDHRRPR